MLIGEKIVLRPLHINDLPRVNSWRNDVELTALTMGIRFPKTLEMDEEWFNQVLRDKSNRNIYWAIDIKDTSEFIGLVSLTNIDFVSGTCARGMMIGDNKHRGKGFGLEIAKLVEEYAFSVLNLRKIVRYVLASNRHLRTLKNSKLTKEEGRMKEQYYMNGEYCDVVILSLFREDYYRLSEKPNS